MQVNSTCNSTSSYSETDVFSEEAFISCSLVTLCGMDEQVKQSSCVTDPRNLLLPTSNLVQKEDQQSLSTSQTKPLAGRWETSSLLSPSCSCNKLRGLLLTLLLSGLIISHKGHFTVHYIVRVTFQSLNSGAEHLRWTVSWWGRLEVPCRYSS